MNPKSERLIPYLCRFQLLVQDLEAQLYFPSSFKVAWKTKDNDQLACTTGFVTKNQLHLAKFQQTLQSQTIMLYNTQTRSYIDKDTFIVVSYYLNSKPTEIKELGKITLKMSMFMEESGDSTVRKGENGLRSGGDEKATNNGSQKRSSLNKPKAKQSDDIKCWRLQGSQYLAKLRYKCTLINSSVSKLTLSSISAQQFNQPLGEYMKTVRKPLIKSPQPKSIPLSIKHKELPKAISQRSPKDTIPSRLAKEKLSTQFQVSQSQRKSCAQLQTSSQSFLGEQHQLKQSNHTQNTKQSAFQQSIMIPSSINQPQKHQHQDKIVAQLQHLQKQNLKLMALCDEQKKFLVNHEKTIKRLKQQCYELQDQLKEKQLYLQNNIHKLQALDHCKYELIELKEYIAKLQQRLTMIYGQKPTTLQKLWRTVTGYRQSLISKPSLSHMKNNQSLTQSIVKINSFSLIDQNSDQKKRLTQSVNYIQPSTIRDSRQKQTHKSIPQHLFMLSSSQIQLTNSEMRQIEGSTVRMQKELSFMQTELYEVKGNVMLQQERYELQCMLHADTKMELFSLQEKVKHMEKQLKELRATNLEKQSLVKQLIQLQQDNQCLHEQIDKLQQTITLGRQQNFKLRQNKQEQQYQLSVIIKQQKIQLESLKQQSTKHASNIKHLQDILISQRDKLKQQSQKSLKMKSQLSTVIKENFRLGKEVQALKTKENEIRSYLFGLQGEFNQVQKIVEEKEDNQEQLHQLILEKQDIIARRQNDIAEFQHKVNNLQLLIDNMQKELALQRIKSNHHQSQSSLNSSKHQYQYQHKQSQKEKQPSLKLTLLLTANNQLIKKNRQLIAILTKNATALVAYQRLKKQSQKLTITLKQFELIKKDKQTCQQENNRLLKDNQELVGKLEDIKAKHQENALKINEQKQALKESTQKLQTTNIALEQLTMKLKQQLSQKSYQLQEQLLKLTQNQLKLNKITKQTKLLQDSQKFLTSKNKTYQTLIIQHQSMINDKQSRIKSLQAKIKLCEKHHYNNNNNNKFYDNNHYNNNSNYKNDSLNAYSYGNAIDQGLSEIKLQSQISDCRMMLQVNDSRKVYTHNLTASHHKSHKPQMGHKQLFGQNNTYQRNNSKPQSVHNQSSYLISPLSQNEEERIKRHQAFRIGQDMIEYNNKKKTDSNHTIERRQVLISMIQSYLDTKTQDKHYEQAEGLIHKLKQIRQNNNIEPLSTVNCLKQMLKQIHGMMNELNKYKTKLIKDHRNKPKSTLDMLVQPLKPIEKSLHSLLHIVNELT